MAGLEVGLPRLFGDEFPFPGEGCEAPRWQAGAPAMELSGTGAHVPQDQPHGEPQPGGPREGTRFCGIR